MDELDELIDRILKEAHAKPTILHVRNEGLNKDIQYVNCRSAHNMNIRSNIKDLLFDYISKNG